MINCLCQNPDDVAFIEKISDRAWKMFGPKSKLPIYKEKMQINMDIILVHLNSLRLDLRRLSESDEVTFGNDIYGIFNNIHRSTGYLIGFDPICRK